MHQKPESETYFHTVTEHKHDDAFDMYKWKRPQRISEAEYLQQEQDVCDYEARRKTTVGQILVGHSAKTAKISSVLPLHDQHVTGLSVCPHPKTGIPWKDEFLYLEELHKELCLQF